MKKNLYRLVLLLLFGATSYVSAESAPGSLKAYKLKVDDELQLNVFLQPDLSKLLTIDREGKVSIPMIEKALPLYGMTRAEAAEEIRSAYADGFLKYPQVDLKITKYSQDFVQVSGQVANAGPVAIPFHGKLDLFTALTQAGWVTGFANTDAIKLMTRSGASATVSLEEVLGEKGQRLMNPGDQIIVSKNRFAGMAVSVEGKIAKPGTLAIPKSGRLDLATAIVLAGGLTADADRARVELISSDGSKSSIFSYAAILRGNAGKIRLRGGDRVLVPQSPFVGLGVTMQGAVMKRGLLPFPLDGKFTLKSALTRAGLSDLANEKKVEVTRAANTTRYNMKDLKTDIWLHPGDTIKVFERLF